VATRTLSRRALRDQNDAAEADGDEELDEDEPTPKLKKARTRKTAAKPAGDKKPAKPRARKKAPKVLPVMFARWAVFDNGMKRVAVFAYKDRAGADAKLAELKERKTGTFFLQLVKDACEPPPVPVPPVVSV
jgi:hypothetical protein